MARTDLTDQTLIRALNGRSYKTGPSDDRARDHNRAAHRNHRPDASESNPALGRNASILFRRVRRPGLRARDRCQNRNTWRNHLQTGEVVLSTAGNISLSLESSLPATFYRESGCKRPESSLSKKAAVIASG